MGLDASWKLAPSSTAQLHILRTFNPRLTSVRLLCGILAVLVLLKLWGQSGEWTLSFNVQIVRDYKLSWTSLPNDTFDWHSLKQCKKLKWVKCYGNKMCTRLEVPLDYTNITNGETAAIAMLKVPAKVPHDSHEYGGPILFNPGGPGGPGVDFIKSLGESFQEIIGDQFDIIGFDPRGIGHTTPPISVFGLDRLERARWDIQEQTYPLFNETEDAMPRIVARYKLYNTLIKERLEYPAQHASTAVVAHDMLSITKAHGTDKLLFWGFSYGTVLGLTYASMFPDNIGRIIVDGNFDVNNYYKGLWSNNLRDADSVLAEAFRQCSNHPEDCALYESTPTGVEARYKAILNSLKKNPIPVHNGTHATFIKYRVVQWTLFDTLARPYRGFKPVFEGLADLERNNGTKFLSLIKRIEPKIDCDCERTLEYPIGEMLETQIATTCTDAGPLDNHPEFLTSLYNRMSRDSSFADVWIEIPLGCVGWDIKPQLKFEGQLGGNTSHPILFIGNIGDPQTPLWAAHKMSPLFKDSVVLTQESYGHCSIAATSLCTHKAVRSYFQKGELPEFGTRCTVTDTMFGPKDDNLQIAQLSEEDQRLFKAVSRLSSEARISSLRPL